MGASFDLIRDRAQADASTRVVKQGVPHCPVGRSSGDLSEDPPGSWPSHVELQEVIRLEVVTPSREGPIRDLGSPSRPSRHGLKDFDRATSELEYDVEAVEGELLGIARLVILGGLGAHDEDRSPIPSGPEHELVNEPDAVLCGNAIQRTGVEGHVAGSKLGPPFDTSFDGHHESIAGGTSDIRESMPVLPEGISVV